MDALAACVLSCTPIVSPKRLEDRGDDEPDGNDPFGKMGGDNPLQIDENLEDVDPPQP